MIKNLPAVQETWVWSLGQKDPWQREWHPPQDSCLESSTESGGLQVMGTQRVGHNWATNTFTLSCKVVSCTYIAFSNWIVIIILFNPHNNFSRYKLLFLFYRWGSEKWRNVHKATRPHVQMISTTQSFLASSPLSTIYSLVKGTKAKRRNKLSPIPEGRFGDPTVVVAKEWRGLWRSLSHPQLTLAHSGRGNVSRHCSLHERVFWVPKGSALRHLHSAHSRNRITPKSVWSRTGWCQMSYYRDWEQGIQNRRQTGWEWWDHGVGKGG